MPKLAYIWNQDEMNQLQAQIIVEMWSRVMGTGSGKRKLANTFTSEEIERIRWLYKKYYSIYFKKIFGQDTPNKHAMSINDWHLTKRVVHFFATI
jgi:hypothetical protein